MLLIVFTLLLILLIVLLLLIVMFMLLIVAMLLLIVLMLQQNLNSFRRFCRARQLRVLRMLGAIQAIVVISFAVAFSVPKKPPHIVLCLVDDLGWNSAYNNPTIKSPTINTLAAEGVKLTSFYAYRYCSPTRASLLTGRAPYKLINGKHHHPLQHSS